MKCIVNFLKGIAISIATMVPGVSGGTMAIILNIYDDLIHSVSSFFQDWKKHSKLIAEVTLGGLVGILLFSNIIEKALSKFPVLMSFFFIGVVIGGVPVLYKKATSRNKIRANYIYLLIGFILALFFSIGPETLKTAVLLNDNVNILFLILAGIIIAIALILPGISGSFILLLLGLYDVTLNAINTFNIKFLIPLAIGILIGTISTTKIIEKLLNKYPEKTYTIILGFVLGSIFAISPNEITQINVISSGSALIAGFILIYCISPQNSN